MWVDVGHKLAIVYVREQWAGRGELELQVWDHRGESGEWQGRTSQSGALNSTWQVLSVLFVFGSLRTILF